MYITLDIGGTNTRIAFFKKDRIIKTIKFKTKANDFDAAMQEIANELNKYENIKGVGVSAPGPANFDTGLFGDLPNLKGWANKNFKNSIKKLTGITNILMENDANLMALAHHNYFENFGNITLFFTVSTGLGAGLVINDKIFKGASGSAMEVAHAPVAWKKEFGKSLTEGALELFSSGSGIQFRGKKETQDVFNSKDDKDKQIIRDGIETLGNMIATSIAIINPNLVVFDGSVTRHNEWYIEESWKLAQTRASKSAFENAKMKISKLGDDAGLYGAYHLIKNININGLKF